MEFGKKKGKLKIHGKGWKEGCEIILGIAIPSIIRYVPLLLFCLRHPLFISLFSALSLLSSPLHGPPLPSHLLSSHLHPHPPCAPLIPSIPTFIFLTPTPLLHSSYLLSTRLPALLSSPPLLFYSSPPPYSPLPLSI